MSAMQGKRTASSVWQMFYCQVSKKLLQSASIGRNAQNDDGIIVEINNESILFVNYLSLSPIAFWKNYAYNRWRNKDMAHRKEL